MDRFDLKQFHFHSPSEHTVEGEFFPLEMHMVHESAGTCMCLLSPELLRAFHFPRFPRLSSHAILLSLPLSHTALPSFLSRDTKIQSLRWENRRHSRPIPNDRNRRNNPPPNLRHGKHRQDLHPWYGDRNWRSRLRTSCRCPLQTINAHLHRLSHYSSLCRRPGILCHFATTALGCGDF